MPDKSDNAAKRGKPKTFRFHPFDELALEQLVNATGLSATEIVARGVRLLSAKFQNGEVDIAKLPPVDPRKRRRES